MKEPFATKSSSRLAYLHLPAWMQMDSNLQVGFSQRRGLDPVLSDDEFNLALHAGGNSESILENRDQLMHALGFEADAFTCAEQVHGNGVYIVQASDRGRGRLLHTDAIPASDGLLTQEKDICLVSFYADCVPLYFYDPVSKVIGLAHAGWKGTVLRIAEKIVYTMMREFGSQLEHIQAAIGPSIGACCYEVDHHVADRIRSDVPEAIHALQPARTAGHEMLDLKESNRQIMIKSGLLHENILSTHFCTGCDTDHFFSFRKEAGQTGRMASWIGWHSR